MIRLITFATEDFTISAERLKETSMKNGVDWATTFIPRSLDEFFRENILKPLVPNSRGYGWWVWKPYLVFEEMMGACQDGDYVIYCDAGTEITGNVQQIIDCMDEDIFFCSNGWQHSHWCKREVAEAINCDYDPCEIWGPDSGYYKFKQVQASFIIFKVNDNTRKFVQEWYAWSIMPGMIDNTPRGPQFPEFQEHRHDQAILTCLQIKYGYKTRWFPAAMNQHQRSPEGYGTILNHHRKRNNEW